MGRVSKEKGLGELAPLADRLRKSRIDHRFIIVGDGPMRAELEGGGLGAVFTGTLQPDQVAVAMASADLFVFPSRTDTAGNVVLEAQASGLPVLVTDSGGPRENMLDGQTGYVCENWRAFARRIGSMAWNPEHRARLADAARRYALGRRWDLALEPLYRSYREAAAPVAFSDRLHARPAIAR